jgi:hypothetical protein
MGVNRDKPDRWKSDIAQSVDMYNQWFMDFAPEAYRNTRLQTAKDVEFALQITENVTNVQPAVLRANPGILPALRMATCPPLAADRLIGLADVSRTLVNRMEKAKKLPRSLVDSQVDHELRKIGAVIERMADPDILVWRGRSEAATERELYRAATIIADRLCGAVANPIIRNAQEQRQLTAIGVWLQARGYTRLPTGEAVHFEQMEKGTFAFRLNVPVAMAGGNRQVNIPVDVAIMPKEASLGLLPVFIEAKSAGDFTNVNKRRKEEALKMALLRTNYGERVQYNLFLCGYFDTGYLGFEAAEGIDWVWEHRIDDLTQLGL